MKKRNNPSAGSKSQASAQYSISRLPTYSISRTVRTQIIPAVADQGYRYIFQPGTLPGWSEFSALYDQYRVKDLEITLIVPRAAAPTNTGNAFPILTYAPDWNDSTAPATQDELLQYASSRTEVFSENRRMITVRISPRPQVTTAGGTNTVSGPDSLWCRTTDNDVWYGLKYWLAYFNTTTYNNTVVELFVKANMEFKVAR